MKWMHALFAALLGSLCAVVQASTPDELIGPLQSRWAEIKYREPADRQAELYRTLAQQARKLVEANPNVPEVLIWEGIVLSSEAGARGGLGALSLAKEARDRLDAALKMNERALDGSAWTSLATLYAKVPGWPLGFGDEARAEEYFRKSLAINPAGIDPNFFYGEYLAERGRTREARTHLDAALKAAPRPGRELADDGRRKEARALLEKLGKDAK
jgi:tetratricopeptide (TPR) repeat protein